MSDTVSVTRSTRYLNEQRVREEECTPVRHPSRIRRRIFLGRKLDRIGDEVRLRGGGGGEFSRRTKFGEITAKQLFPSATFVFRATNPNSTRGEIRYEVGGGGWEIQ